MDIPGRWRALKVGICVVLGAASMWELSAQQPLPGSGRMVLLEMQKVLAQELAAWYPRAIDSLHGGYLSELDFEWKPEGRQNKMIVTQARHVWTLSKAARFYNQDTSYRVMAAHGVYFLRNTMWDSTFGGFFDLVERTGKPIEERGAVIKRAYGNAFAIYGLAAYFETSHDTISLDLAKRAFWWLEQHSYDSLHGGYFQFLHQDGTPFVDGYAGTPPKDMNSSIHLVEAFTELYRVWPHPTLRGRLSDLLHIVRDVLTTDKGTMTLFHRRDWTPLSFRDASERIRAQNYSLDHVSFGHDIETAYLVLEAAEALNMPQDDRTITVARKMVLHSLGGWDQKNGGLFDGGYYRRGSTKLEIVRNTKEWWAQVEAMHSFLLFSDILPDVRDRLYEKFQEQWEYCKTHLIDHERGGWYWGGTDIVPENARSAKGTIWKGTYHTGRALMNCISILKNKLAKGRTAPIASANPNASPEAVSLLSFLYSINGNKTIAGHHNYTDRIDTYPDRVQELTGKRPAIWGCDFIHYYRPEDSQIIVEEATRKHKEGYIVTLMWHAGRPQDDPPFGWKQSVQADLTDGEWNELLSPGTSLHSRWERQVDTVAAYLRQLRDRGVPVLWRLYHELNGMWFWWGNRKGPNGSAGLYRMMYDRFVHHHKLDNLIWVWNANAPRQLIADEAYAYADFYPGSDFVDVLAADVYHNDYRQSHHDELLELGNGKLIALGEVGNVPTPGILDRQPFWAWFMVWGDFVDRANTPDQMRALYGSPRVSRYDEVKEAVRLKSE